MFFIEVRYAGVYTPGYSVLQKVDTYRSAGNDATVRFVHGAQQQGGSRFGVHAKFSIFLKNTTGWRVHGPEPRPRPPRRAFLWI